MNNWKKIWESRKDTLGNVDAQDYRAVFVELKRIDGFDVNDGPSVESLLRQYENTKAALTVWGVDNVFEVGCGAGADELPTDKKYDAVFSNGVFPYFNDFTYAERVLEKMLQKSRRSVAVLGTYDKDLEEVHMNHRRQTIADYDERYKDLPKLFYPRSFFEDFAARHNLSIRFTKNDLEGYGNALFTYHCFMERRLD